MTFRIFFALTKDHFTGKRKARPQWSPGLDKHGCHLARHSVACGITETGKQALGPGREWQGLGDICKGQAANEAVMWGWIVSQKTLWTGKPVQSIYSRLLHYPPVCCVDLGQSFTLCAKISLLCLPEEKKNELWHVKVPEHWHSWSKFWQLRMR